MCRMKRSGNIVGYNIQKLRKLAGFTQEELALRSGLSQGFVNHLEHGKKSYTQKSLERIAAALSVPVRRLYDDDAVTATTIKETPAAYPRHRFDKKEFLALLKDLPEHIADYCITPPRPFSSLR